MNVSFRYAVTNKMIQTSPVDGIGLPKAVSKLMGHAKELITGISSGCGMKKNKSSIYHLYKFRDLW